VANNYAELIALRLALILAFEKEADRLQVSVDSQVVIQWMDGSFSCENFLRCFKICFSIHISPTYIQITEYSN
jgi:ribonuclease HI